MKPFNLIILMSIFMLCIPIVLAQQGTFYYANESINYNSKDDPYLQWRVEQGAEVYTGRSYDISGAIGTSGFVAHWSDWKAEDQNCAPDTIIPVRYVESNGAVNPANFYISSEVFPAGNYYAWDGCREWTVLIKQPDGSFITQTTTGQAPNENRFAFTVKNPKKENVPFREPSAPTPYVPPAFVVAAPVQTAVPVIPVLDIPTESAPWWIQWWWLELIVIGIVGYVINEQYDIL
jgi:hypothetical protein